MSASLVVYALVVYNDAGTGFTLLRTVPTRALANELKATYPEKIQPRLKVRRGTLKLFNT